MQSKVVTKSKAKKLFDNFQSKLMKVSKKGSIKKADSLKKNFKNCKKNCINEISLFILNIII